MQVHVRTLSNNIVLRPVIELSLEDLGRSELPFTRSTSSLDWLSSLEAAGIRASREVVQDSGLVFADEITSARGLRTVTRAHLTSGDGPGLMSPLSESALQGGFVLMEEDEVVLTPGCCGHLGHITEWRRAAQHRNTDPLRLRIGHPEVSVTYENGLLCLHEKHDIEHQNRPRTLRVAPAALTSAVASASVRVAELMKRLRGSLGSSKPPPRKSPLNGMSARP